MSKKESERVGNQLRVNWNKVDLKEFTMGMNVELEHTNVTKGNLKLTGKITLAHLEELPDYYTRLKEMEK